MTYLTRISLAVLTGLLLLNFSDLSWGKDIHFVARDFEGNRSVWHTDSMLLERPADREEVLTFVLENPTDTEHAFVMPGAQMITREQILMPESGSDISEPMRIPYVEPMTVTVKPGESKRLRVHASDLFAPKSMGVAFRYFCTIHKDVHQAGSMFVM
jgi:hypothetical protein